MFRKVDAQRLIQGDGAERTRTYRIIMRGAWGRSRFGTGELSIPQVVPMYLPLLGFACGSSRFPGISNASGTIRLLVAPIHGLSDSHV